jgi:hypothetical protein
VGGQAGRRAGGQAGRRAGRRAGRQAGGQAGRQTGRRACRQAGRQAGGRAGRPHNGRRSKFSISRGPGIFVRCAAVNMNVLLAVYKHIDGNMLPPPTDSGHI